MTTMKAAMLMAVGPAAGLVSTTVLTLTEGVVKAMFIAKIKTATVVLCGVAALGLGTSGVVYQTRAGAADPQKLDRVVQDRPKRGTDREQERDNWRKIAEEAQAREKKLQAELDQLRAIVEDLRAHANAQQKKAERERLLADRPLEDVRQRKQREEEVEMIARKRKMELAANRGQRDQPASNGSPDRGPDLKIILDRVELQRAKLLEEYQTRIKALKLEQQLLEEQMRKRLAELDQGKAQVLNQYKLNDANRGGKPTHTDADKLDRVLERLERLEKRLDRLEKGRQ